MNKNIIDKLLIIAGIGLLVAGAVFLCLSIFSDDGTTKPLACALGCILLGNLFNLIRQLNNKKQ